MHNSVGNTENEAIVNYLVANHDHLKALISDLALRRDRLIEMEPKVFHDDIRQEFSDRFRQTLVEEVCKHLPFSAECATLVIEQVNPDQYITAATEGGSHA